MCAVDRLVMDVADFYRVIPLRILRRTEGVRFDELPLDILTRIDAVDRVVHDHGAISPGKVGSVERPWYVHTHQDDHLLVLHGMRTVELYRPSYGRIECFEVCSDQIRLNDQVVYDGPALLSWSRGVFHRIRSSEQYGSASLNFARHYDGFDIRTNFSIYQLDTTNGEHRVIREGHLDQPNTA